MAQGEANPIAAAEKPKEAPAVRRAAAPRQLKREELEMLRKQLQKKFHRP